MFVYKSKRRNIMNFEKTINKNTFMLANWTNCENCDYKTDDPPSSDYHKRSSQTAADLNAANNGKSCVSG